MIWIVRLIKIEREYTCVRKERARSTLRNRNWGGGWQSLQQIAFQISINPLTPKAKGNFFVNLAITSRYPCMTHHWKGVDEEIFIKLFNKKEKSYG